MNIVIAGAGAIGIYVSKLLVENNHNVLLIDKDSERLKIAESQIDLITLQGSSSLISVLTEADTQNADMLIAVTNDADVNFVTCILAKKLGVKTTIARISDQEYLIPEETEVYRSIGVDHMIYPERIAALEIVELLRQCSVSEAFTFSQGKLSVVQITIEPNAQVINKKLKEVVFNDIELDYRAVSIQRGEETIIPTGDDVFLANDHVYVIVKREKINKLLEISGKKTYQIKNIMMIGGTKVGKRAAIILENEFNIKLIEKDRMKCEELSQFLNKTMIINANGHDIKLLMEEGLNSMDAVIAVTDNTEANIFICLLAKRHGVKRTIALVDDVEFIEVSQNIGVDTIVNKKLIAAGNIFRFTLTAEVIDSKTLNGVDADVYEFIVKPDSRITQKKIKEMNFPKGALLGGVVRGHQSFIVNGETLIEAFDHVIVFSLPSVINDVEKFFK